MPTPPPVAPSASSSPGDPWQIDPWRFPEAGLPADKLRFALQYAILAPSSYNRQPWLFKIVGEDVALYADRDRHLRAVDPQDRALLMSCGAALFHLRLALRHFGYTVLVRRFPDFDNPDLLAFVRLGRKLSPAAGPSIHEQQLFQAITERRTNRQAFEPRPVPEAETAKLVRAALAEGAHLHVLTTPDEKADLAHLIAAADQAQGEDPVFRHELGAWLTANRSDRRDGMPGYSHGLGEVASVATPLLARMFDWGDVRAAHDQRLAEDAPLLALLTTRRDTPLAWLRAGEALARVLLTATTYGLSASFLNQPLEIPALRAEVAERSAGWCPQMLMRLGYGPAVTPTPRRPVQDVLTMNRFL